MQVNTEWETYSGDGCCNCSRIRNEAVWEKCYLHAGLSMVAAIDGKWSADYVSTNMRLD